MYRANTLWAYDYVFKPIIVTVSVFALYIELERDSCGSRWGGAGGGHDDDVLTVCDVVYVCRIPTTARHSH
jgi:hypothetical protein